MQTPDDTINLEGPLEDPSHSSVHIGHLRNQRKHAKPCYMYVSGGLLPISAIAESPDSPNAALNMKLLKLLPLLPSRAREPWSPPLQVVPPWPVSSHLIWQIWRAGRTQILRISQNYRIANLKKCEQLLCGLLRDVPILSRNHHINVQFTNAVGRLLDV